MDEYYVYIDEAGDEGFGKLRNPDSGGQSVWLMLGAIIVAKSNDRFLPTWCDEIMDRFQKKRSRDLHFKTWGMISAFMLAGFFPTSRSVSA